MSDPSSAPAGEETAAPEPLVVHGHPAEVVFGTTVVHVDAAGYLKLVTAFHKEGYTFCTDLCGVDHLGNATRVLPEGVAPERFEVVVSLRSLEKRSIVRIRCQVEAVEATVPTLFPLYPGTEAMEREVYDMFGIRFDGHPDLTRILMPDEWEGHPLRKDFSQGRVPVQFKHPAQTR